MTPTPCATCGYPINPGALHYANDRGSHHSTCGDPLGMKATAGRIAELEAVLCFWIAPQHVRRSAGDEGDGGSHRRARGCAASSSGAR